MTKPRPTLSLFRKPKPEVAVADIGHVIPIRVVSRRAIEQLVESFNRSAVNAD